MFFVNALVSGALETPRRSCSCGILTGFGLRHQTATGRQGGAGEAVRVKPAHVLLSGPDGGEDSRDKLELALSVSEIHMCCEGSAHCRIVWVSRRDPLRPRLFFTDGETRRTKRGMCVSPTSHIFRIARGLSSCQRVRAFVVTASSPHGVRVWNVASACAKSDVQKMERGFYAISFRTKFSAPPETSWAICMLYKFAPQGVCV